MAEDKSQSSQLSRADELGELLTPKQRAFADAYIADPSNQGNAYLKVYKCASSTATTQACEALKNPKIKNYIRAREHEIAKEAIKGVAFTREGWLNSLYEIAKKAADHGKFSSAIRAIELIGKSGGYVEDSLKLIGDENQPVQVVVKEKIDLNALSVAELKQLQRIVKKAKSEERQTPSPQGD